MGGAWRQEQRATSRVPGQCPLLGHTGGMAPCLMSCGHGSLRGKPAEKAEEREERQCDIQSTGQWHRN